MLTLLKRAITGAQLKALCADPSQAIQPVTFLTGMLGAGISDVVAISEVQGLQHNQSTVTCTLLLDLAAQYSAEMSWYGGVGYNTNMIGSPHPLSAPGGVLSGELRVTSSGGVISDINDDLELTFWLTCGILETHPGVAFQKLLGANNGIATLDNAGKLSNGVMPTGFAGPTGATGPSGLVGATGPSGVAKLLQGTTNKPGAFQILQSATVASNVAVFHLTDNGLSGGNALFPTAPILDSVQTDFNDSGNIYTTSYVWSNSNKTLTITANKLNLLALGLSTANGAVCKLSVWGN